MKKFIFLLVVLITGLIALPSNSQQTAEKKVIATLGQDETLAYGEDCFLLDKTPESISFVTVVGSGNAKQFYCYGTDGSKTGPVKSPDPKYWNQCEGHAGNSSSDETNESGIEKYVDWTDGSINFNGKKIGPYGQVIQFQLSGNGKYFYAVALSQEMKLTYFDNTGKKIGISGSPEEIIISPDGTKAVLKVSGSLNPFDPESLQKMMNNPEELNNPKIYLVSIGGETYGPYPSSSYNKAWFTDAGQWIIYANSEFTLDGRPFLKSDEYISPDDLWISKSGNDYAWSDNIRLHFKDGTSYTAPLEIQAVDTGGNQVLKWVSLDDGKKLTLYRRPFK